MRQDSAQRVTIVRADTLYEFFRRHGESGPHALEAVLGAARDYMLLFALVCSRRDTHRMQVRSAKRLLAGDPGVSIDRSEWMRRLAWTLIGCASD